MTPENNRTTANPSLCALGVHDWSVWERITANYGDFGVQVLFRRVCRRCGKTEERYDTEMK